MLINQDGNLQKRHYTHLLRNILSNYWCGMHLTCKNNPVKLTGIFGRFEVRNLSEVFMRQSSDAAHLDCENRTVLWIWNCWNDVLPVLGLAGCHWRKWKIAGTFSQEHCSVFVGRWLQRSPAAPCFERKNLDLTSLPKEHETWAWDENEYMRWEPKKYIYIYKWNLYKSRSFTSLQMFHTHTLPQEGVK